MIRSIATQAGAGMGGFAGFDPFGGAGVTFSAGTGFFPSLFGLQFVRCAVV